MSCIAALYLNISLAHADDDLTPFRGHSLPLGTGHSSLPSHPSWSWGDANRPNLLHHNCADQESPSWCVRHDWS
eukprot:2051269-Pyramimonas_sp.AAC.1